MAVSKRFFWREEKNKLPLPVAYYMNFLPLQKKHFCRGNTLHKNANYLQLNNDQRKCLEKFKEALELSSKQQQFVTLIAPAGVGM